MRRLTVSSLVPLVPLVPLVLLALAACRAQTSAPLVEDEVTLVLRVPPDSISDAAASHSGAGGRGAGVSVGAAIGGGPAPTAFRQGPVGGAPQPPGGGGIVAAAGPADRILDPCGPAARCWDPCAPAAKCLPPGIELLNPMAPTEIRIGTFGPGRPCPPTAYCLPPDLVARTTPGQRILLAPNNIPCPPGAKCVHPGDVPQPLRPAVVRKLTGPAGPCPLAGYCLPVEQWKGLDGGRSSFDGSDAQWKEELSSAFRRAAEEERRRARALQQAVAEWQRASPADTAARRAALEKSKAALDTAQHNADQAAFWARVQRVCAAGASCEAQSAAP